MSCKHKFLSEEWMLAFELVAQKLLDASDAGLLASFTYVEHFSDAPMSGADDGKATGYVMTISDGKVAIKPGIQGGETADCSLRMDYAAALESMRFKSGPELSELSRRAAAAGGLEMTGSLEAMPIPMNILHDEICDRTLPPAS
ncbi:MAG: hypothetical protein P8J20_15060 [Novosphingobium sp.]|nr:hypothetical protein [Novosphingobium sp.]